MNKISQRNLSGLRMWVECLSVCVCVCVCVCMLHIQIRKSEQIFADIYFTSYKSTFNTNFIFTHFITMADFFHLQIKQTSPTANEYI